MIQNAELFAEINIPDSLSIEVYPFKKYTGMQNMSLDHFFASSVINKNFTPFHFNI